MTTEELNALVERFWGYGTEDSIAAVAAIRHLMKERDEAWREGQRNMQLRALEKARRADIFADIQDLEIYDMETDDEAPVGS